MSVEHKSVQDPNIFLSVTTFKKFGSYAKFNLTFSQIYFLNPF